MAKKRMYSLFVILLCLFFLFKSKEIFSQTGSNIQPFRPDTNTQQHKENELIKQWAKHYKNSYGINRLYAYKAAGLNLPSVCNTVDDSESCKGDVEDLLWLNNLAMGRCDVLKAFGRNICKALKKGDCSSLKKDEKLLCQGFLDLDPEILKEGLDRRGDKEDKEEVRRELAFYSAFKNGNVTSCTQFISSDSYVYKVACRVLLSSEPQRIIDALALDFAYYAYSDSKGKKDLCDKINDIFLREKCKKGVSLSAFVDKYFLED